MKKSFIKCVEIKTKKINRGFTQALIGYDGPEGSCELPKNTTEFLKTRQEFLEIEQSFPKKKTRVSQRVDRAPKNGLEFLRIERSFSKNEQSSQK